MTTQQDLLELQRGGSILGSLGQQQIVQKLAPLRALVRFAVAVIIGRKPTNPTAVAKKRRRIVRLLKFFTPYQANASQYEALSHRSGAIIFGFNHPSLGDIPRTLCLALEQFPARRLFVPANLKYVEAFAACLETLEAVGIELLPIVTPSLAAELERAQADSAAVRQFSSRLQQYYLTRARACVDEAGVMLVAPSATRQATVFRSKEEFLGRAKLQPTMTLLTLAIKNQPLASQVRLVPLSIIPPNAKTGVNLLRRYRFETEATFTVEECVQSSRGKERKFEFYFLKNLARTLPVKMHYPVSKV